MAKRGKCFAFKQGKEPGLKGNLYEDNVFFAFASRAHENACRPFIGAGVRRLGVRLLRY